MQRKHKENIVLLQRGFANYRDQLFRILSNRHDIHFLFASSTSTYPGMIAPSGFSSIFMSHESKIGLLRLIFYLLKHRPNIVISSTSYSIRSIVSFLYANLFRKRFILWILEWRKRRYASQIFRRFWRRLRNVIGITLIKHSHALVVGGSAAECYALSLGKDKSHIFMAMNCANDIKLKQKNNSNRKTCQPDKYTFLYLSKIIPRKGLDILLKAFSLLIGERTDVFLLIGGDGHFRPFCEKLAASLQIPNVIFLGPVNQNSVTDYYEQADVFILPSYYHEGLEEPWGLVINEAMSMSLPVITTTAVGAAYDLVIDEYNGFVVMENDVKSLYKAMDKILGKDLLRMGINSRTLFDKKNDFVQMANGFTSAIEYTKTL